MGAFGVYAGRSEPRFSRDVDLLRSVDLRVVCASELRRQGGAGGERPAVAAGGRATGNYADQYGAFGDVGTDAGPWIAGVHHDRQPGGRAAEFGTGGAYLRFPGGSAGVGPFLSFRGHDVIHVRADRASRGEETY